MHEGNRDWYHALEIMNSLINYTVFKRKTCMQMAKHAQLIILYSKEKHVCKWLNMEYLLSYQLSCQKKLFKMQVHNSYPLNFIFICQKSLPDDLSTIMLSETFLLRFYSIRNSIILIGIVLGGKASSVSVSLEKVNDVNIFSNNMYYYVKHNLGQCPKDCKKST